MATVPLSLQVTAGADRIAAAFGYTSGDTGEFLEAILKDYLLAVTCAFEAAAAGEAARLAAKTVTYAEVTIH